MTADAQRPPREPGLLYTLAKRVLDVGVSVSALAALSPLLAAAGLAVKLYDGGPALFKQRRIGKDFEPFEVWKFRTMTPDAEAKGAAITKAGDSRITPLGRFLRRTKLDELPQLVNVLTGEMSLVGPRPEVERYVRRFEDDYRRILSVRPGLTDYAALDFIDEERLLAETTDVDKVYVENILPRKIELYYRYLDERSLATDLRLIARTLARLVGR
ncbi:MAG: sugar transferase [Myxococcales bacterium]|nr:MAG: sugar transferase [Myxococcales bacterium]